ncbi:3168_t:CDS:2, partial [Funneliformis mosseae]
SSFKNIDDQQSSSSPENIDDQQPSSIPNLTNTGSSFLISPFKTTLKFELETLQLHLKCLFFRTRVINKQIIDALVRTLFSNIQSIRASNRTALQI